MGKKSVAVVLAIIGIAVFGYIQYASASQISVAITNSKLIEKTDKGSLYNLELEFKNPTLLMLNAGKTDFTLSTEDKTLGGGILDPFMLPAMGKVTTNGIFLKDHNTDSKNSQVKISGTTKYQLLFATLDVPFTYYPTQDQTREFIQDS
ncbi:MAG: hypothetical protein HW420_26 [Candidatus Nitrosotenuis sp.]|jgi:hypothetical protein|nr:hypothetical protein [Candidatus Nitrosotenuis sp.]